MNNAGPSHCVKCPYDPGGCVSQEENVSSTLKEMGHTSGLLTRTVANHGKEQKDRHTYLWQLSLASRAVHDGLPAQWKALQRLLRPAVSPDELELPSHCLECPAPPSPAGLPPYGWLMPEHPQPPAPDKGQVKEMSAGPLYSTHWLWG